MIWAVDYTENEAGVGLNVMCKKDRGGRPQRDVLPTEHYVLPKGGYPHQ